IEMQVRVDHQINVARGHVQPGERVRGRAVDHPPVVQPLLRPPDAGVHQHRAAGVGDHETVHRPLPAVDTAQAGQMQPLDLQRHPLPPPTSRYRPPAADAASRPGQPVAASKRSTISEASASDEVAAGDGAFLTCVAPGVCEIAKSSSSRPSRPTACARTPLVADRSILIVAMAGMYCAQARTNALRLAAMCSSRAPVRQNLRTTIHVPGQLSVPSRSRGRSARASYASRAPTSIAVGPSITCPSMCLVTWTPRNGSWGSGTG